MEQSSKGFYNVGSFTTRLSCTEEAVADRKFLGICIIAVPSTGLGCDAACITPRWQSISGWSHERFHANTALNRCNQGQENLISDNPGFLENKTKISV